ncbi:hypothetical protein [Marinobacter sp.]|uniref:hypothetical protein n=1 Tax=Marinobacter sp. TaxID=50741 RepID=UPI0035C67907
MGGMSTMPPGMEAEISARLKPVAEKVAKDWAERAKYSHNAHCLIFERLNMPHNGHVIAWEKWKATPWTWRNHLAAMINAFIRWTERDD